jgi:hypothetical protein
MILNNINLLLRVHDSPVRAKTLEEEYVVDISCKLHPVQEKISNRTSFLFLNTVTIPAEKDEKYCR